MPLYRMIFPEGSELENVNIYHITTAISRLPISATAKMQFISRTKSLVKGESFTQSIFDGPVTIIRVQ